MELPVFNQKTKTRPGDEAEYTVYKGEDTLPYVGDSLLLVADGIGRWVISPSTIQVGVITAFIGAPLFLYLIVKSKKEAW